MSQIVHTAALKRWKLSSVCRFLRTRTMLVDGAASAEMAG